MKKEHHLMTLTAQIVAQLMYCSSRLATEDFEKVSKEMMNLVSEYQKKTQKLKQNV